MVSGTQIEAIGYSDNSNDFVGQNGYNSKDAVMYDKRSFLRNRPRNFRFQVQFAPIYKAMHSSASTIATPLPAYAHGRDAPWAGLPERAAN